MTEKSINVEKDMLKSSKSLLSENKILNKDINSLSDNIEGLDNTLKNTKFSTELNNKSTGNNNTNSSESNNNTSNSNDKLTSQNSNSIKAIPITLGENYALSDDGKYLYAKGSTVKLSSSDYVEINGVIYDIINSSVGDVKIGNTHSVNRYRYGINKYAKGSPYIPYDQRAIVDEEGEEFIAHREHGRIETLKKGDTVIPAKTSETLASLIDGNGYVKDSSESKEVKYVKAPYEITEILMKKYFQGEDSIIPERIPKILKGLIDENGRVKDFSKCKGEERKKVMEELTKRILEYFQDEKILNRLALRGYEDMMESFDKRINELIINNTNNNTTINNYNNNNANISSCNSKCGNR